MDDSFRGAFRQRFLREPVSRPVVTDAVATNQFAAAKAYAAQVLARTQAATPRPIPSPLTPAQYAGGGGGVVANDILGQRGPVVLAPPYAGQVRETPNLRVAQAVPPQTNPVAANLARMAAQQSAAQRQPIPPVPVAVNIDDLAQQLDVAQNAYFANPSPETAATYESVKRQYVAAQQATPETPSLWDLASAAPGAIAHGVQTVADAELDLERSLEMSDVTHGIRTVGGAAAEGLGNIPLFTTPGGSATVGEVVGQPQETAAAIIGNPIAAIHNNVPGAKTVMDLYQRPYNWNVGRTGQDIYDAATTGRVPGASNPYFYVDSTIPIWSQDPANKDKIVAAHDVGLDLNEDGVIDIKGQDAVWMVFMNEVHPGFLDNMITQMGFDPLFAAAAVAPAATGARVGAEVGLDALRPIAAAGAATKSQAIRLAMYAAIEKLAIGVERVGDVGNVVADAPFTMTVGAARKINQVLPPWLGRAVDRVAGPGEAATVNRTVNAGEEFADVVQGPGGAPSTFPPGTTEATNRATVGGNVTATPQGTMEGSNQATFGGNATATAGTPGVTEATVQPGPGGTVQIVPGSSITEANAQATVGGNTGAVLPGITPGITEATNRATVGGPAYIQFPYDPTLAALPAEIPTPPKGVPRLPSPATDDAIPLEVGTIQPEVVRRDGDNPYRAIRVDGEITHRVVTITKRRRPEENGYQVQVKGPNGKYTNLGAPYSSIDEAEAAAVEAAGGTPTIVQEPTDFTSGSTVPDEPVVQTDAAPSGVTTPAGHTVREIPGGRGGNPLHEVDTPLGTYEITVGGGRTPYRATMKFRLDDGVLRTDTFASATFDGLLRQIDSTVKETLRKYPDQVRIPNEQWLRENIPGYQGEPSANEPWSPTHPAYTRDPVLADIPVDRRLPTDLMTAEERSAAMDAGEIPSTMPWRQGNRVIDQAWRRGDQAPGAWDRFWKGDETRPGGYEERVNAYIQRKKSRVEDAWFPKQVDAEGNILYQDNGKLVLPQQKEAEQVIASLEHLVDDIIPSFQQAFSDLPEVAPVSKRKPATTRTIKTGKRAGEVETVKASYREENLPYLYERYVVTESEKDAAKILNTLEKRTEIAGAPWWPGVPGTPGIKERLIALRERLRAWYAAQGNLGIVSPGSRRFIKRGEDAVPPVADLTGTYVDDVGDAARMSPEDIAFAQYARQRVKKIRVKKSGKWQDGKASDVAAYNEKHPDAPYRGNGDFKSKELEVTEVTNQELLQDIIEQNPDATAAEISHIFGNKVADLTGVRPDARIPMARWVERTRSVLGTLNNVARQSAIYNLATGWRGLFQDQLSNMIKSVMDGHLEAVPASAAEYVRRLRGIRRETPSLVDQTFADYGLTTPPKMRLTKGKTEVTAEGRTATHRLISDVFGVEEGSRLDKGIGIGAGVTNSRIMRDARNGADNVSREAVAVSYVEKVEHDVRRDFMERARARADAAGIMPNSVDAYLDPLGRRFSVDDVRTAMKELADDAALPPERATAFAGTMADDWRHAIGEMRNNAANEVDRVFFSYERTGLDEFLGNFIFYHYWMSRAIPAYARIALRNPEIAAMWFRAWDDIKKRAEKAGYPESMMGYIRFMGSPAGWNFGMHPLGLILPIADLMPAPQDDATLYEQITQFVAVTPVIGMAAAALGLTDDVTDPLMSYSVRNMLMAGINKLRAERGDDPKSDPYEVLLRKGTDLANQFGSKLPFGKERIFVDPMTFNVSEIRYNLAEIIAQDTGVPTEQWVIDGPEYQRFVAALTDNDAGIDNADYDAARQEWADAELQGRVLNSAIPGGVRTRYGPRDEMITTPYDERTDQQKTFKGIADSGNTPLEYQQAQLNNLGTEEGRQGYALWNDIVYTDHYDELGYLVIGDQWISTWDLEKMSQEGREAVADRWLAQYEGVPEAKDEFAELRKTYLDTHPEMGDFKEFQRGVGTYDNEHGPGSWAKMFAKDHEQFATAMAREEAFQREQGKTGAVLDGEMAQWAMGTGGYNAAIGEQNTIYDEPRDPTAPDFGFEEQESGSSNDPMEAVKNTIERYEKKVDEALVKMQAAGYAVTRADIDSQNPYYRSIFASFGVPAEMPEDYLLYRQWKAMQSPGVTVEGFITYLKEIGYQQAAA